MRHSTKQRYAEDDGRDVARLDKAMSDERQEQGDTWSKVLKRGLDKRFDERTSPFGH